VAAVPTTRRSSFPSAPPGSAVSTQNRQWPFAAAAQYARNACSGPFAPERHTASGVAPHLNSGVTCDVSWLRRAETPLGLPPLPLRWPSMDTRPRNPRTVEISPFRDLAGLMGVA